MHSEAYLRGKHETIARAFAAIDRTVDPQSLQNVAEHQPLTAERFQQLARSIDATGALTTEAREDLSASLKRAEEEIRIGLPGDCMGPLLVVDTDAPRSADDIIAEAPDGSLHLDIGARLLPDGSDAEPIIMIDYEERCYQRRGRPNVEIPDRFWHAADLDWRTVRVLQ